MLMHTSDYFRLKKQLLNTQYYSGRSDKIKNNKKKLFV